MPTFTVQHKNSIKRTASELSQLYALIMATRVIPTSPTYIRYYDTLALMKEEADPSSVKLFVLLGQLSTGDGLMSGQYYYDITSAIAPDNISIIQLTTTSTGRLIKLAA